MNTFRILGAVLAGSIAATVRCQDQPLTGKVRAEFIETLGERMGKVQTVVAKFEQEKHYSLFDDVVKHRGFILYSRPDKLRWEIQEPFRSILIVSASKVAKFEFHKDKRRKLELGRAADVLLIVMDQVRSWFRGDFAQSARQFHVDFYATAPARIVLRPKSKSLSQSIQSFELELAKDLRSVSLVRILEKGGDKTIMHFTKLDVAAKLDPMCFDIEAPRDFVLEEKKPPVPRKQTK